MPTKFGVLITVFLSLLFPQPSRAQGSQSGSSLANPRRVAIAATTLVAAAEANRTIDGMLKTGDLKSVRLVDDAQIAGRQSQTLQQFYKGIPVEGASVTLQKAGARTISLFGTLYNGISLDTTPGIAPIDAARIIEQDAKASIAFGATPTLVIVPTPLGAFALNYKATVDFDITYYVDALTGTIARRIDEKKDDVGLGTGTLGDQKKMATTLIGSTYRTKDTLRPAGISTYDTQGGSAAFNRMVNGGTVTDNDLASNSTNTWTNGYVVDAHTNTGFVYDYFFRQHKWSALDGNNRAMSVIVHSGLVNNAEFIPAPFGPHGNGVMVFGRTRDGVPVAALDVAGHELMHGVTEFSLTARTGSGFTDNIVDAVPGPTSFVYKGGSFPCSSTFLVDSLGDKFFFVCDNGRYVLAANQQGAINEGFSDIFGTSVEFFYQPPGDGPLKADYLIGEDITGFGPIRSLNDPASIPIAHDFGATSYPDSYSKVLTYALLVIAGTPTNPSIVTFSPVGFQNGNFLFFFSNSGPDNGGVHFNSTIISHAFYLAIEGGQGVSGVGGANRAEIEKVFFRAMTQLMPNNADLSTAAAAVIQAAVDLYGQGSAVTQAVTQAMTAVGLR